MLTFLIAMIGFQSQGALKSSMISCESCRNWKNNYLTHATSLVYLANLKHPKCELVPWRWTGQADKCSAHPAWWETMSVPFWKWAHHHNCDGTGVKELSASFLLRGNAVCSLVLGLRCVATFYHYNYGKTGSHLIYLPMVCASKREWFNIIS